VYFVFCLNFSFSFFRRIEIGHERERFRNGIRVLEEEKETGMGICQLGFHTLN